MCHKIIPSIYHMLMNITKNQTKLNAIAPELGMLTGLYVGDIKKASQELGLKVQSNINEKAVRNIFKESAKGAENTDGLINSMKKTKEGVEQKARERGCIT